MEKPFTPPNLNVALQPLKFMEFSLEQTTQASLFCEEGAVLVNVPSPIRYALHKLLVWGEREQAYRVKASKDLVQAAAIIEYFRRHRAHEISETWADLLSRGKGWRQRAAQGAKALAGLEPDLAAALG